MAPLRSNRARSDVSPLPSKAGAFVSLPTESAPNPARQAISHEERGPALADSLPAERDEGCGKHHALDPAGKPGRRRERDQSARRVCENMEGQPRVGQHDMLYEALEVEFVVGKASDVPLAGIRENPLGAPLPAPVEGRHPEAHRGQVADRLEIFLDDLVAPVQQDDRPARLGPLAPEHGVAHAAPVESPEEAGMFGVGRRIAGRVVKDGFAGQLKSASTVGRRSAYMARV